MDTARGGFVDTAIGLAFCTLGAGGYWTLPALYNRLSVSAFRPIPIHPFVSEAYQVPGITLIGPGGRFVSKSGVEILLLELSEKEVV